MMSCGASFESSLVPPQLEIVMGVSKEWAKAAAWPPQQVFEAFYWW